MAVEQLGAARGEVDDLAQGRQVLADLEEPLVEPVVADHGHLRLAVTDQVGDLLGRRRVVDRDGCGAAEHAGHVDDVEVVLVAHHQDDPVARPDARGAQARAHAADLVGVVDEGALDPLVAGTALTQRHPGTTRLDGAQERCRQRLPLDCCVHLVDRHGHAGQDRTRLRSADPVRQNSLRSLVEQLDDGAAQLRGVHVLGDQAERELVAAAQDPQHEVLAPDGVVLVRQRFSQ